MVIGVGGIGFDVVEFFVENESLIINKDVWLKYWGIDKIYLNFGVFVEKDIIFL